MATKGWNALAGYTPDLDGLQESLGTTQFGSQNRWHHTIAGLLFQGGIVPPDGNVTFLAAFNKQILAVHINGGTANHITLEGFQASSGGHWFAIGV